MLLIKKLGFVFLFFFVVPFMYGAVYSDTFIPQAQVIDIDEIMDNFVSLNVKDASHDNSILLLNNNITILQNNKAQIGNCNNGFVVMNTTSSGVQCIAVSSIVAPYNDTNILNYISNVNKTSNIQNLGFLTSTQINNLFYNKTYVDGIYNYFEAKTNNINTTNNIMSLGFYNNTYVDDIYNYFYYNYYNSTQTNFLINNITPDNTSWNKTYADTLYEFKSNNGYIGLFNTSIRTYTLTTRYVFYNFSGFQTDYSKGFTTDGTTLTSNISGLYHFDVMYNLQNGDNDNNQFITLINGVPYQKSNVTVRFNANLPDVIYIGFVYNVSVNDTFLFQVNDLTRNAVTLTMFNQNIKVTKVEE